MPDIHPTCLPPSQMPLYKLILPRQSYFGRHYIQLLKVTTACKLRKSGLRQQLPIFLTEAVCALAVPRDILNIRKLKRNVVTSPSPICPCCMSNEKKKTFQTLLKIYCFISFKLPQWFSSLNALQTTWETFCPYPYIFLLGIQQKRLDFEYPIFNCKAIISVTCRSTTLFLVTIVSLGC